MAEGGSAGPSSVADKITTTRTFTHVPALDGLRGLAVIGVLLFHAGHLRGGYLGVDAFFVLSGFLITSLLLVEADRTGRIGLRAFWARRFRRLLPALVVLVLGVSLYAVVLASTGELGRIRGDALATLGYVANWNSIFRQHGYWELFSAPSPLEHTWSLAIEEQFYLLWPLVFAGVVWWSRRAGRSVSSSVLRLSVVLAVGSASLMWYLYTPGGDTTRVYLGTDTRAAAILLGVAFAAWRWARPHDGAPGWGAARIGLEVAGFAAAAGLALAWTRLDGQDPFLYRGGLLACGMGVVVVIAASAHAEVGPLAKILAWRPLRWFGLISYGLYLWHWPVDLVLDPKRTGLAGWPLVGLQVVAAVALAVVSYHLIEQPIRRNRFTLLPVRYVLPIGALVSLVAVVLATGAPVTAPVSRSISQVEAAGGQSAGESLALLHASGAGGAGRTKLLVVGDSLANSIAAGAAELGDRADFVVAGGTVNGCALTNAVTALHLISVTESRDVALSSPCEPVWTSAFAAFRPNLVLVVFGNASGFERFQIGGNWMGPCDASYRDWYVPELTHVLEGFRSGGAGLAIATLPYPTGAWLPDDARARIDCMNHLNAVVGQSLGADTVDLGAMVCPGGKCLDKVDGGLLRADGIHFGDASDAWGQTFGGPGARYAARWVLDTLGHEIAVGRARPGGVSP